MQCEYDFINLKINVITQTHTKNIGKDFAPLSSKSVCMKKVKSRLFIEFALQINHGHGF